MQQDGARSPRCGAVPRPVVSRGARSLALVTGGKLLSALCRRTVLLVFHPTRRRLTRVVERREEHLVQQFIDGH